MYEYIFRQNKDISEARLVLRKYLNFTFLYKMFLC